jgi:hypothetical protein
MDASNDSTQSQHWQESIGVARGFLPDDPLNALARFLEIERELRTLIRASQGTSPELERLAFEAQYSANEARVAAKRWQEASRRRALCSYAREASSQLRH